MTEAEWLESRTPHPMLYFLNGTVSDRKMCLFALACCRRCPYQSTDSRPRHAIDTFARWLEMQASDAELQAAFAQAKAAEEDAWNTKRSWYPELLARALTEHALRLRDAPSPPSDTVSSFDYHLYSAADLADLDRDAPSLASGIASCAVQCAGRGAWLHTMGNRRTQKRAQQLAWVTENEEQAKLVRDIMGNPFRPAPTDPFAPAIVQVARTIYDGEAFDRMPELARALEGANCSSQQVLDHCRGPGPHVRGCWVVDLVLDRA